jgi:hypothetical protein
LGESFSFRASRALAGLALAATLGISLGVTARAQDAAAASAATAPLDWGMLEEHCFACHNFEDWAGGVAFDVMSPDAIPQDAEIWEHVLRKLRGHLMPPPSEPQPAEEARQAFIHSLESQLDAAAAGAPMQAGYVPLHRLNRAEYANAVKALFDLEIDAEKMLPPDFRSDGFENVADVLAVSPTFLDQYIAAARDVSVMAVGDPNPRLQNAVYPVEQFANHTLHVEGLPLGTRDGVAVEHYFPVTGDYIFTIPLSSKDGSLLRSYPMGWLEYEHTLVLAIDDAPVHEASVGGKEDLRAVDQQQQAAVDLIQSRFANIRLHVEAGTHRLSAAFLARTFAESDDLLFPQQPGEGLDDIPIIVRLEVLGPFDSQGAEDTPSHRKIFSCYPEAEADARPCAESIVARLAEQAFRRPAAHSEVQTLMGFYDAGYEQGGFEVGVQKAIMAMLASTKFLYRAEEIPEDAAPGATFALSDVELASRLSYFLWSQGPDEELLELAGAGRLADRAVLEAQVRRMLADPRSKTLVTNFAVQWLEVEVADTVEPDPRLFPDFDPDLRAAFRTELELFIDDVLRGDHSIVDLLDANYTFVNERLGRHYGLQDVRGSAFRRVELADSRRRGLLGKGGILMLTSYPNRTSPVRRGAWILNVLMGTPPASPPPNVEANLDVSVPGAESLTVRERIEQHRADPSCNQCHGVIDPWGMALENYDAVGQWRDHDRYARDPIDATGQLAGGGSVGGPDDVRAALAANPDQFVQTFVQRLMTYATGRRMEYGDMPTVRAIVRQAAEDDYQFSKIVMAIVESPQFGMKTVPAADVAEGGEAHSASAGE